MEMEESAKHTASKQKDPNQMKERKRKKKLLKEIQKQVEFYFGDANLRHDRFLRKEISTDPEGYVSIDVIASFNKMKTLSNDVSLIIKALKNSSILQVSENEKKVKRVVPLPEVTSTDSQTIYVERLPPFANHDWLRQVFSTCGEVEYISLPRFKNTGQIKGFAFIEYSTADEALKACQVLNTVHAKRDKHREAEEYGQLVRPHENETKEVITVIADNTKAEQESPDEKSSKNKQKLKARKRRKSASFSESDTECNFETMKELAKERKRRRCMSETTDLSDSWPGTDYLPCKKRKRRITVCDSSLDDICGDLKDINTDPLKFKEPSPGTKRKRTSDSVTSTASEERIEKRSKNDTVTVEDNLGTSNIVSRPEQENSSRDTENGEVVTEDKCNHAKKEKKRKRKKKTKEQEELFVPQLYVISKKEWLEMKRVYKSLQRGETSRTKAYLKSEKANGEDVKQNHSSTDIKKSNENLSTVPIKPLIVPVSKGTVLRIFHVEEDTLKSSIKDQLSQIASVAYLDFKEGEREGYVRFTDPDGAKAAMESLSMNKSIEDSKTAPPVSGYELAELTEAEEEAYYKKIEEDRRKKFDSKSRTKHRGKDKVQKKVDRAHDKVMNAKRQHVRFEDFD